jgi:6,7-dimethyl-8-ribityllumazine synthase
MAKSGRYRAIVAVGCILGGETPQFIYLSQATTEGLALAGVVSGVPITCGVVTAKAYAHALARSKPNGLNRGQEAAQAAWEMAKVFPDAR